MQPIKHPVARALIYLFLSVFVLYSVIPFVWTLLQSLKTVRQANAPTPLLIFKPTWDNYAALWLQSTPSNLTQILLALAEAMAAIVMLALIAWRLRVAGWLIAAGSVAAAAAFLWGTPHVVVTAEFYGYFVNTLIVTAGTVVVSISIGCLAGYALARYSGIDGVVILVVALAFRALPRMAFILPYFWLGQLTGLHDTYFLLIICLVAVNQPFTIWMLRSFFMDIPREIEESAMVDGANHLTAFLRVILPITWPGIISTALFTVLLAYNEFLLVTVLAQSNWTLPVAIAQFTGGEDPGHMTISAAAAVSATIPIVILILFFQKQLVKGLAAGAVKG